MLFTHGVGVCESKKAEALHLFISTHTLIAVDTVDIVSNGEDASFRENKRSDTSKF